MVAGAIDHLWTPGWARSSENEQGACQNKHKTSAHRYYELLWREYFKDPKQWWDNRSSKVGASSYPDFKHKLTKQPLWLDGSFNPPWVFQELKRRGLAQPTAPHTHKITHSSQDVASFVALLKTCAKTKDLTTGSKLHDDIITHGLLDQCSDSLIIMYSKCGALATAQKLLDMHTSKDAFAWGALILGYVQQGQGKQALACFERMQQESGLSPNAVTFACILKACGSIRALDKGEQIHDEISRQGLLRGDIVLGNALVDMYAKCGALAKARQVLEELPSRNVNSWTALITGYAQQGLGHEALSCFERMKQEGLSPDALTFSCILKACGSIGAIDKGEQIHEEISGQGFLRSNIVLGTAVVDMYAKCGALAKAQLVLEELPQRDVVTWSALITGYTQQGQGEQALTCFDRMRCEGFSPNAVTYSCILKACGCIGDGKRGEQIHDEIHRKGLLKKNIVLGTALVDMYAKCGALTKARKVLEELPSRDAFAWSALITGYVQHGQGEQALKCFEEMKSEGHTPDAVTLSSVLNACSHLGLVDDAHRYLLDISTKYGVRPALENYACIVDLFGRAGHLDKAVGVIKEMPSSDYSAIWCALLSACLKWGDVKVGKWAFDHAVQVDRSDASPYVLMANIYAAAGMQADAKRIEAMRMEIESGRR